MSNTEETPEINLKRSSYVDEFLESGRKKARNSLSTEDNQHIEDLEYMLKSVRALIKIINEIWDKCKGRLTSSEDDNNLPFTFEREIRKEVKVEKIGRNLTITTQKLSNTKDFGSLPAVPEDLRDLIHVNKAESDILPDYNRYIEKSSILCEEVLLPFLTSFQEHLKEIQVFLGKIEEWLIETEVVVSFLSELFEKQLDDVEVGDVEKLYRSYCLDVDSKMESKFNICTEKGREGLKSALKFIKVFYEPISQIEVKDAGEKAVNGMYTLTGVHDDNYFYSRSGVWDGKPTIFYLSRQQNKKIWFLNCEKENQPNGSVVFYLAEATGEENELPPLNGWGKKFKGVDPPPQILYKIDD